MKTFSGINYVGGLTEFSEPTNVAITIDDTFRRLAFKSSSRTVYLDFDKISDVSLNEKSSRSGGKAAAGAIVGGLLTGGIGLLARSLPDGHLKLLHLWPPKLLHLIWARPVDYGLESVALARRETASLRR